MLNKLFILVVYSSLITYILASEDPEFYSERKYHSPTSGTVSSDTAAEYSGGAASISSSVAIERLLGPAIPDIARGHEEIYLQFVKGFLIYKPERMDAREIALPIAALPNPLEGTFDLSKCGHTGEDFSISTGYRKGKKAENTSKIEIWITPKFVVEKELATSARHLAPIMESFTAPIGIFWNYGNWDDLGNYNYLTWHSVELVTKYDLGKIYSDARRTEHKNFFHWLLESEKRRSADLTYAWTRGHVFRFAMASEDPEFYSERKYHSPTSGTVSSDAAAEYSGGAASISSSVAIERLLGPAIPDIARGHEEIYLQFVKGFLIYKPERMDAREIALPIAALPNPLEGTFDLSKCGDIGKHLSINTGYRKGKKAENTGKAEIWITPKFVVEKELATSARHLAPIMESFIGHVGLFWNDRQYDWSTDDALNYNYLVNHCLIHFSTPRDIFSLYDLSMETARKGVKTQTLVKDGMGMTMGEWPIMRFYLQLDYSGRQDVVRSEVASVYPSPTGGAIVRPLAPVLPDIARGYEDIYRRFMNGRLIYKPYPSNDVDKIEIPFASIVNPATLEGTFDLKSCRDTGTYLSISTGYRKGKKAENSSKVETWIVPKFVVEQDLGTTARHLAPIMGSFTSPLGLFWTWGGWDDLSWYDYWVPLNFEDLCREDLYENWKKSRTTKRNVLRLKELGDVACRAWCDDRAFRGTLSSISIKM